jgi:hypothetical protein
MSIPASNEEAWMQVYCGGGESRQVEKQVEVLDGIVLGMEMKVKAGMTLKFLA